MVKVNIKGKYDYKKTLIKFVKVGVPVIIAGVASIYGESSWYLAIAPLLSGISNFVKHKLNTDLKII